MSEYQYYEFLAVDRPLTRDQLAAIRRISSRAELTATSFVNEYEWGSFKGDPVDFLARYYDLMLYYANWGTHTFMVSLPADAFPKSTLAPYTTTDGLTLTTRDGKAILTFDSQDEMGLYRERYDASMAPLAPLRAELLAGDLRPLYLGWLSAVGPLDVGDEAKAWGDLPDDFEPSHVPDDANEPPVPPGLGQLTPAQVALAEFLRIDEDLIAIAAQLSPPLAGSADFDADAAVAALPPARRDRLLADFLRGDDPHLAAKLRRELAPRPTATAEPSVRTAGVLRAAARAIRESREDIERQLREQADRRREAERRAAHEAHLTALAARGADDPWADVEREIEARTDDGYRRAVNLLADLRELAARAGDTDAFATRLARVRERHGRKSKFLAKLKSAKLG